MELSSSMASCMKGMMEEQQSPSDSLSSSLVVQAGLDNVRLPFAYKLHLLLCDMEVNGCENIISWVEDGSAFKIHDQQKFEEVIQPLYFRQSKITSFIRQCYAYGFSKLEFGPGRGAYVHPNFQRKDQQKSLTIQRHTRHYPSTLSTSTKDCSPKIRETLTGLVHGSNVKTTRNIASPCGKDWSPNPNLCMTASARSMGGSDRNSSLRASTLINHVAGEGPHSLFVDTFFLEMFRDDDCESDFEPRPIEIMLQESCNDHVMSHLFSAQPTNPGCH